MGKEAAHDSASATMFAIYKVIVKICQICQILHVCVRQQGWRWPRSGERLGMIPRLQPPAGSGGVVRLLIR